MPPTISPAFTQSRLPPHSLVCLLSNYTKVVGDGDVEISWEDCKRQVQRILRELLADARLAGNHHLSLQEYKDAKRDHIPSCDTKRSATFRCEQMQLRQGNIVLYIDKIFIKQGAPVLLV